MLFTSEKWSFCVYKAKGLLVVSLLAGSLFLSACGGDSTQSANPTPTATPESAHSVYTTPPATVAPPTVIPQPTSTVVKTAGSLQDQVLQIAQSTSKKPSSITVDSQFSTPANVGGGATIVLLDDLNTQNAEAAKAEIFKIQKAVWTSPTSKNLGMLMVWITQGQTPAGDPVIFMRGSLSAQTEANFQWDTLTPDTAWTKYDPNPGQQP